MFEGINFSNNANHTIDYISNNAHETAFYDVILRKMEQVLFMFKRYGYGGNFSGKNLQTSASISTGWQSYFTSNTCTVGFYVFDALTGVRG